MDKKKIDKKAVGKRIFNIRNSLNLTLEQFGKLDNLNAKKNTVWSWEECVCLPNKKRLEIIAKIGNITLNELLYGDRKKDIEELYEGLIRLPKDEIINLMERVAEYFKQEGEQ